MLRSRIDEQSQLIMMLKNRTDEHLRRSQVLERMNQDLERCHTEAAADLGREARRSEMLERRFADLAYNHEELIKIKDEYKTGNELLRRENARLQEENDRAFCPALQERDKHIQELETKRLQLRKQCQGLEEKYRQLSAESKAREEQLSALVKEQERTHGTVTADLEQRLQETERKLKETSELLQSEQQTRQSARTDSESQHQQLSKQKDDLLELAMHRGKLIQEKQVENKTLSKRIDELKLTVKQLEEKFEAEAATVNTSRAVCRLREELDGADRRFKQTVSEFNAYKEHSKKLLTQERELNERLRHLAG